jgi:hypothetical protein
MRAGALNVDSYYSFSPRRHGVTEETKLKASPGFLCVSVPPWWN